MSAGGGPHAIRSFGRRRGRPLRPAKADRLARLLDRLSIGVPSGPLDPATLFAPGTAEVWLEIGFGGGEHLARQAASNPAIGLLGAEPFVNGLAGLAGLVETSGLANVRVWPDDARPLLDILRPGSIGRVFVLFPDPWPKRRHRKRRLFAPATVAALAAVLADGAELRVATDDPDYAQSILFHVLNDPAFEWTARGPGDWRARPGADWPETRYETKARLAGRRGYFLRFQRRPRAGAG